MDIRFVPESILLLSLTLAGEALASPKSLTETHKADERIEYATTLNSIASTIMSWYGSLLTINDMQTSNHDIDNVKPRFSSDNPFWEEHRSTYPEQITSIKIADADLIKQETPGQYQFEVELLVTYIQFNNPRIILINEIFFFQMSDVKKPEIRNVSRVSLRQEDQGDPNPDSVYQHKYYKSREIAYAWLAYLDGVNSMGSRINIDNWLNLATHHIKIGSFELREQLVSSLKKRNKYLGVGGHLLRSITTNTLEDRPDHFELELIIDWKGITADGKPALAKIRQLIQYKIQEDGSLIVSAIKEKHLLPDMEPWQNLLC